MAYTTADLLSDIKLRVFAPTDQRTLTDTDFLAIADSKMQTVVLPIVQSLREEYLVTHKDYAVTQSQAAYDIPVRAVGMQLRDVFLIDSLGMMTDLPAISPERREKTGEGDPEAFFVRMNQVHLYPVPRTTVNTLRLEYFLRPGKLIETSSAGQISAIDTGTGVVTLTSIPSTWSSALQYDFIRQDGGGEPRATDQTATSVASLDVTFASLPTGLAVGDYLALAGESPIPQLPPELRPVLVQAVVHQVCATMNLPALTEAKKILEEEIKAAQLLLTPRVVGEAKKVFVPRRGAI